MKPTSLSGENSLYLDDLQPGQRFYSRSIGISAADIMAFAAQFDPQPFHLDAQAAMASIFQGLVASGWHTAALTMRLLVDGGLPIASGAIGMGGEISWPQPTRPGDILSVESEILEVRPSRSKPDRGIVKVKSETRNQHGESVQSMIAKLLVLRRA
jgi:acyl dehydratase